MIRSTCWITAAVVAFATSSSARAEPINEIRAVTYSEDRETTRVVVRGAQTPTFTAYKLDRPTRVVLDVPRARLADSLRGHEAATIQTANTWAVSSVAAQQIDEGNQIVRVIVTLARPGRYDVKTEGAAVVVAITARDPAPEVDAKAIKAAQADATRAKEVAAAAQAEADRLRKAAADQAARAEAAQRAVQQASAGDVARARSEAEQARRDAAAAQAAAASAQNDAERTRRDLAAAQTAAASAQAEARKSRDESEAIKQQAARDAEAAKHDSELARKARDEAEAIKQQARRDAEAAKQAADAAKQAADAARAAAERDAKLAAEAAAKQSEAAKRDLARVKGDADAARREAVDARREAERARNEAARSKQQADELARQAEAARGEAAAKIAQAENTARTQSADAARTRAEADAMIARVKQQADNAIASARAEAQRARNDADAARNDANSKLTEASRVRAEADKATAEAKRQLAMLDKKLQATQQLEDKARAANAAAEAREQVARDQLAAAKQERAAAEQAAAAAVKRANQAASASTSERDRLAREAQSAEQRLVAAKRAADEAEARRAAAESAATSAKSDLDQTRTTLASVEKQRSEAETAASSAARRRSEAETAANAAAQRRSEAEAAVSDANKRRVAAEQAAQAAASKQSEAEQQRVLAEARRKVAEDAARTAKAAAEAADKQRAVAEQAATAATTAKRAAEQSLAELTTRRLAAEKAAADLEARSKAEAKAQAELVAAQARKASDAELAKARGEATRLADDRKRAESELADRRRQVATQQAEANRLEAAAATARDAATREETRRAKLAEQRVAEERELSRVRAERDAAAKAVAAAPAATPSPAAGKLATVRDVEFRGSDGAGEVAIAVAGDAKVTIGEVSPRHVELIIDNAELAAKLERKLDVSRFGSPVRAVSSFRDRRATNRVRLIAELSSPVAPPTLEHNAKGYSWRFLGADDGATAQPPRTQSLPPPVIGGFGATSTPITQQSVAQVPRQAPRRRVYRGAILGDLDVKDAPIHDLLRLIADTGRINIIVPEKINAKVTVKLKRVPWDQALEVILASQGLWYRQEGNLYRVADRKELDQEDKDEADRRELAAKSERPQPRVIRLNYADAHDLAPKLEGMKSPAGTIQVDERQNALIVNDISGNRAAIEQLALSLDTQTPQIAIEARIVEARSTFLRQFGVQWGGRAIANAQAGNATGLLFPNAVSILGGNEDNQTVRSGVAAPSDFAVNLPAAVGSGEGGGVGMSLGSIGGNFALNLRLTALEDAGTIRIISAPKITVLNNKRASILSGVSIPIQVISAQGTQTQLVQADLRLQVTPYVSPRDCAVQMQIEVSKNEPDFVNVGARGDPSFLRKEASTTLLVSDGDTTVLGGIYTRNTGLAYKKIPFFGDLPVIGWFFKNRRENDDRTEILVFITPKITNKGALACQN